MDAATAVDAEVRLYDNLFSDADPDAGDKNFLDCLNPSLPGGPPRGQGGGGLPGACRPPPPSSSCARATSAWTTGTAPRPSGVQPLGEPEGLFQILRHRTAAGAAALACGRPPFRKTTGVCVMKKVSLPQRLLPSAPTQRFWRRCAVNLEGQPRLRRRVHRPGQGAHPGGASAPEADGAVPHRRHPDQLGGLLLPAPVGGGICPDLAT